MRGANRLAMALLVVAGLGAQPGQAADGGLKSVLEARYAAMKTAMAARDGAAVSRLLAPDFVSVDVSGQTETAAQMTGELAGMPVDPNKVSQTTLVSVKPVANTAIVDQRYDMKTTKTGADGVAKNVELITLSTDTWIKSGGAWLMQRTVTRQIDYFINGQSVMHKTGNP